MSNKRVNNAQEQPIEENGATEMANTNAPQHLDIKKMKTPNAAVENDKQKEKELAKQQKKEREEEQKQQKLLKEQEKKEKKNKKESGKEEKAKEAAQAPATNGVEQTQRLDAVNELFKTPPAGVYPKTDKQGRVIKYKKRGGVFAFFVGIFFSLFLFIFCGGLVASYFYYCYNIKDVGDTLGVDTSFLPQDTKNKTANQIVSMLLKYKDGYVNMTVGDAKDKLGLDVETIVEQNLGVKIEDFNEIELTLSKVNNNNPIKIKNMRVQDIINNMQDFIDALLPELYKKIPVSAVLDLFSLQLNLDKPLTQEEIFDVNPNPTFDLSGNTYTINYAKKVVTRQNSEATYELKDKKFTIADVEYTISDDQKTLNYAGGQITLVDHHNFKRLEDLSIDEVWNSIIPNYISGNSLTIEFLQNALGIELISKPDPDHPNPDYDALLKTDINNLKIDKLLDSVSLRSFETLLGLELIPLNDNEKRYDSILDQKIGKLTASSVTENVTMGAFLDLLKVDMPDLPFLNYDEFKGTSMKNLKDYVYTLKVNDFLNNIIEEVHPHDYFTKEGNTYYTDKTANKIYQKAVIEVLTNNTEFPKINDTDVLSYIIRDNTYLLYDNYLYGRTGSNIDGITKDVTIGDVVYTYDKANSKLVNKSTLAEISINANKKFFIYDNSKLIAFGTVDSDTQITYYEKKDESKITGRVFRLKFNDDTTISYKLNKDNKIEYLKEVADIDANSKFTIGTNEYTLLEDAVTLEDNSYPIYAKSSTLQIALYSVSDLTVKNIIDGDLKGVLDDDAKLSNLLLTDIINKEFTGLMKNLNGLSVGEIVDSPDILIDRIKVITLSELMGIDNDSSPLLKAIANAELTIGDLMEERAPGETNPIIAAMGKVTFFELGVKNSPTYLFDNQNKTKIGNTTYTYVEGENKITDGVDDFLIETVNGHFEVEIATVKYRFIKDTTGVVGTRIVGKTNFNPLISILEKVTIDDILQENGLYDIIKNISLAEITESNTGIMKILGDIKFDDFGQEDVITNKLKTSYGNLAELLDQQIYFYNYFVYDDTEYYVVDDMGVSVNGVYKVTDTHPITFTQETTPLPYLREDFEYGGQTYYMDYNSNILKDSTSTPVLYHGVSVPLNGKKFVFVDNKLFIDSGSYVYELTKTSALTTAIEFTIADGQVTEVDGSAITPIAISANSTLNNAMLSIRISELFNGDFSGTLTKEVKNIKLTEILGDVSGNKLLSALVAKNKDVTINTLGDTINTLTMGEVFGESAFNSGVLKIMNIKDTALINVTDAITGFDFASQTMNTLIDEGILDFGSNNAEIKSSYGAHTLVEFINAIYSIAKSVGP